MPTDTPDLPIAYSPKRAAELTGFSVRQIYRFLEAKAITGRRSGSRTLIDGDSLRTYYASLPAYVGGRSMPNSPQLLSGKRRRSRHV